MEDINLSFIHPMNQTRIYGGMALLALASRALFTRYESVKIVAMTTLSSQIAISALGLIQEHYIKLNASPAQIIVKELYLMASQTMALGTVRSKNVYIRVFLKSIDVNAICVAAITGCLFALASRAPLLRLKQKVTLSQLTPFTLTSLAIATIVADVHAKRIPITKPFLNREGLELIKDDEKHCFEVIDLSSIRQEHRNRQVGFLGTSFILILAILVGTVAYRAGLIFKKPS